MKVEIGRGGGKAVSLDLEILLRTRLLIQANSGGGKSYTLRRLSEQLFGKIPVLIIDPEGEFATLREKFGYILVGKGGETPADVRSARLLAHRLLELRASAVCDIYELKPQTRHAWVKIFLEAIVDAPKSLWRPTIIIVDEAHVYCPEKGQGESEAFGAMSDLVTRGRKRGFCPIFATQRLAKLSKNVSAEMLNRLVGQTFEDVDLDRAADLLSVPRSDREKFEKEMKVIEPGYFWGFGRAIAKDRILVKIGAVKTTHPEPGTAGYSAGPPPTPAKVKALLPKLSDLPREADERAKTEADLKIEIRSLKAQLSRGVSKVAPVVQVKEKIIEVPVIGRSEVLKLKEIVDRLEKKVMLKPKTLVPDLHERRIPINYPSKTSMIQNIKGLSSESENGDGFKLLHGERRILEVLAQFHPGTRTRSQLGALAGYTPSGGTFLNYFGRLRKHKLISEMSGGAIGITDEGLAFFGDSLPSGPKTSEELIAMWRSKLLAGERKMLDVLVDIHPDPMTREELGERTGYTHTGGTFLNYLGTLKRNALVVVEGVQIKATDALFETA